MKYYNKATAVRFQRIRSWALEFKICKIGSEISLSKRTTPQGPLPVQIELASRPASRERLKRMVLLEGIRCFREKIARQWWRTCRYSDARTAKFEDEEIAARSSLARQAFQIQLFLLIGMLRLENFLNANTMTLWIGRQSDCFRDKIERQLEAPLIFQILSCCIESAPRHLIMILKSFLKGDEICLYKTDFSFGVKFRLQSISTNFSILEGIWNHGLTSITAWSTSFFVLRAIGSNEFWSEGKIVGSRESLSIGFAIFAILALRDFWRGWESVESTLSSTCGILCTYTSSVSLLTLRNSIGYEDHGDTIISVNFIWLWGLALFRAFHVS